MPSTKDQPLHMELPLEGKEAIIRKCMLYQTGMSPVGEE